MYSGLGSWVITSKFTQCKDLMRLGGQNIGDVPRYDCENSTAIDGILENGMNVTRLVDCPTKEVCCSASSSIVVQSARLPSVVSGQLKCCFAI